MRLGRPDSSPAPPSATARGRGVPASGQAGSRLRQVGVLRAALRSAREDLARALARAEEVAWQRDVARAQAGRWRLEYRAALKSRDLALARRDALASALPGALSAVLSTARAAAWDEGWQDARAGGLVQGQNPYSADDDPVPGSPAARLTTCRAYLHFLAERRQAGPAPGHRP